MTRADRRVVSAAALAVTLITAAGCADEGSGISPTSTSTTTTMVAGAGVLGNDRRPDESCAAEPARPDPGPPTRSVRNAADVEPSSVEVPEEPQRIVVLSGDQLDALCALGLQSRIVGAALPDGSQSQPSYLGAVVHDLPAVGNRSNPDLNAIAELHPDLILGSQGLTPGYSELAAIAPTVFTGLPGGAWEDNVRGVGAATARTGAVDEVLGTFAEKADAAGETGDATHFQASVVQLTDNGLRVYGVANFAATVLKAVGVDRPASQRFTDQPYIEISASESDLAGRGDFSAADGDIVYVSFASPAAKARAATVFDSVAWRRLAANRDSRVFVVNNEIWQTGQGPVAATGVVADLRWVNAPIN
ncbi:iron-siderophore ABC transporter substrate-binding protein [[Mycobacterium] nativiensis]|uniref:Iron-siderophore ABC transporter substrate-binding protein n=1 Tax=[Mycobacterium] nativiensis TaxID=2855503 RepID=A0ABU5Y231_9MYCO|nr:iron-siderophore ABC transporter substrate-binding protein [Mycolicibacter sp. MYC340]MEB3034290.1 iron-siderophore ABC transporter substrate-binding protein [Mycolicibacter sp. MYC340]